MPSTAAAPAEMIFHHPAPIAEHPSKGSQLRPLRMIEAFGELGFNVVQATGSGQERRKRMREIRRDVARGRQFAFCYAESLNVATALSDSLHLPIHPIADPWFFAGLRRAGIPSGIFLRDLFWRFPAYRDAVAPAKRLVGTTFHRLDLAWYARLTDRLYLPSSDMSAALPSPERFNIVELPPGTVLRPANDTHCVPRPRLRLGYIGSVSPPYHDIQDLLTAVASVPEVELCVCLPRSETQTFREYQGHDHADVTTCHHDADEVSSVYEGADVMCVLLGRHDYLDFAMPIKLFEALGYGRPCISYSNTAMGDFIESNGFGWTVRDDSDLVETLGYLTHSTAAIGQSRQRVLDGAHAHTWTARAAEVAADLGVLGVG